MTDFDPAEYYHDGGTMRRITPDVPTGICGECGERYKTRPDGTVKMHTRPPAEGELRRTYWCRGGYPAHVRWTA
jgi:hypothetical protein